MEIWDPVDLSIDHTKECKTRAYKRFTMILYLENLDRTKYRTHLSGLAIQYLFGLDQYPQSVEEVTNVLLNHKFDQAYYDNKKNQLQGNNNNNKNNNKQRKADCQPRHNEGK